MQTNVCMHVHITYACVCVCAWLMLLLGCCYCCLAGFECTKQTVANVAWYICMCEEKARRTEAKKKGREREKETERVAAVREAHQNQKWMCVCVCQSMRVIKCVRGLSVSFSLLTLHKPFSCRTWQNSIATHKHTYAHIHICIILVEREKSKTESTGRATNMCR